MLKNYKNKGYTLIELLAVIVILAIIALIAVPKILNVIDDARRSAAEDSTYGYIKGIELETSMSQLKNIEYEDKEDYLYNEIPISVKGMKPTGGIYSLKNGVVTRGVFCVDGYVVNYIAGEKATTDGSKCDNESLKLQGSIKLSRNSGQYPNSTEGTITDTFEVTENLSGGKLSCKSSDESIVTCSISGNVVTLKIPPGEKKGNAELKITSAETEKYKEISATYYVATDGLISYTVNGYKGTYDGEEHGITITNSDKSLEISYGTELGKYDLDSSPTYKNAGTYTVYYQIKINENRIITGSKEVIIEKADGEITLETTSGQVEYDKTIEIGITKNKSNGELTCTSSDTNVATCKIENNILQIKGKTAEKTATIVVKSAETTNYESATVEYTVEVTKTNNTLKLESASGNYTYPNSGEVEVIENTSGGTLTCTSSNTSVATCKIEGSKIKIIPGTTSGQATITVKSAETDNYKEGIFAYVVNTAKGTLNSYTATGYNGTYDGSEHGITVESSGATIKYGTSNGTYDKDESPKYSDVGEYTVYYKIEKEGYNEVTGSEKVVITKAAGKVTSPTAKTLTYTGEAQELINKGSSSTGTIEYKIEGGTYSESIPKATKAGTYKVYYRVVGDKNHKDVSETSISVTISKATLNYTASGYSGIYDGEAHGITVESSGATIKYGNSSGTYDKEVSPKYTDVGEYTVYYQITREGYNTVSGSKTVVITKANNTLKLSSNTGNYTYPTSGTFEITENKSGGTLTCTSSNTSVATCSISGTTVTVTPGTTQGNATLTIKSAETTNYKGAQVSHVATTAAGTLSVTANGYSGTYDGASHGITVTASGATIKYGTSSGSYTTTTNPTYTNVGTYTVYYQVSKAGYKTVTGSKQVVINDSITISSVNNNATSITVNYTGGTGVSKYKCYYGTTTSLGSSKELTSSTKSCTISTSTGTKYYYKICSISNVGTETCSSVGNTTTWIGIPSGTYQTGQTVTYGGQTWYVVSDNGGTTTLISSGNIATGAYTSASSSINSYITNNTTFNLDKSLSALTNAGLPTRTTMPTNASNTPFWTSTAGGNGYYILGKDGSTNGYLYTKYTLNPTTRYYSYGLQSLGSYLLNTGYSTEAAYVNSVTSSASTITPINSKLGSGTDSNFTSSSVQTGTWSHTGSNTVKAYYGNTQSVSSIALYSGSAHVGTSYEKYGAYRANNIVVTTTADTHPLTKSLSYCYANYNGLPGNLATGSATLTSTSAPTNVTYTCSACKRSCLDATKNYVTDCDGSNKDCYTNHCNTAAKTKAALALYYQQYYRDFKDYWSVAPGNWTTDNFTYNTTSTEDCVQKTYYTVSNDSVAIGIRAVITVKER